MAIPGFGGGCPLKRAPQFLGESADTSAFGCMLPFSMHADCRESPILVFERLLFLQSKEGRQE